MSRIKHNKHKGHSHPHLLHSSGSCCCCPNRNQINQTPRSLLIMLAVSIAIVAFFVIFVVSGYCLKSRNQSMYADPNKPR